MHRAREYVELYNEIDDEILALSKISGMFVQEAYDLKRERMTSTVYGIEAILKELNLKWRAFATQIGKPEMCKGFAYLADVLKLKEKLRGKDGNN